MAENSVQVEPSTSKLVQRKKSRKWSTTKEKLPTPPPDPCQNTDEHVSSSSTTNQDDFFEYLDTLKKHYVSYSKFASALSHAMVTERAFDDLEKYCDVVDEFLTLRSNNERSMRRVRDLEHFSQLLKLHKAMDSITGDEECPDLEKDTAFAETILESILCDPKGMKNKPSGFRQSIMRKQRQRSVSTGEKMFEGKSGPDRDDGNDYQRRASVNFDTSRHKTSKVSKWTKVKAAFKWEKASSSVVDSKSQDSGIAGMLPVNVEVARYLRVPSTSDDPHSPSADSGATEISTPGSLSTASSNEDFHRTGLRTPCDDFMRSSDDEHFHNTSSHSKDDHQSISPRSSQKSHRTPWAKMKEIIHTRSSFKKKNRLSAHSDDVQIGIEPCSDNDDNVFEEENKTLKCKSESEIPTEVVLRYQDILTSGDPRKTSKWSLVKKAFLMPNETHLPTSSPNLTTKDYQLTEIDKNYRELQRNISREFQDKLTDCKYRKQTSPGISATPSTSAVVEESTDPVFIKKMEEWQKIKSQNSLKNRPSTSPNTPCIGLTSEENLPPEFKKKLQEWEKIKKSSTRQSVRVKDPEVPRYKSRNVSAHCLQYPVLSDEFRKKLDEWREIKAKRVTTDESSTESKKSNKTTASEKTPSPNFVRKNSDKEGKDNSWLVEKESLEKEKQKLERERQILEREERLMKLRRSLMRAGNKKEILVHTPSGFYRYCISRKFTQKLYEWEKSQGIGPESSTFTLLNSPFTPTNRAIRNQATNSDSPPKLQRSKSADSVAVALNLNCTLISQPSSLSLNDVDNLEKECLADSKSSSMNYLLCHSHQSDLNEPEALIVEVEDFVEETASPLRSVVKQHNPVYQREEVKALCESETCLGPKVIRSESRRAQSSYNLIEDIFGNIKSIVDTQNEIEGLELNKDDTLTIKDIYQKQSILSSHLCDKLNKLQEENASVILNITKEQPASHITEMLESVQDLTLEIVELAESLHVEIVNRIKNAFYVEQACARFDIDEFINDIKSRMLVLRRNLSYICAATDLTAPGRNRFNTNTKSVVKQKSLECDTSDKTLTKERMFQKSDNAQSQGAIKKRIRYRQKQQRSVPDDDDTDDENNVESVEQRKKPKRLSRTRSTSESSSVAKKESFDKGDLALENHEPCLHTKVEELNLDECKIAPKPIEFEPSAKDSPVTIFVKTTRKLFTPIVESQIRTEKPMKPKDDIIPKQTLPLPDNPVPNVVASEEAKEKTAPLSLRICPASPIPPRRALKEISPSIRIMLAKYNQNISKHNPSQNTKSGGSSGSASPIAWRSPVLDRRVKAQTEKYQEEIIKNSPLLGGRREVQKSASYGLFQFGKKQVTVHESKTDSTKSVLKSSSASVLIYPIGEDDSKTENTGAVPKKPEVPSTDRALKLAKAKEEFLKSSPANLPQSSSTQNVKYPKRNRLSQISCESSSSYSSTCPGNLTKSVSVGMINIDAESYKRIDPEMHGNGYVSLPRNRSLGSNKFAFSNIASKFRKVRMRKGKEKKLNVISTLCRQSLVVDITTPSVEDVREGESSTKDDVSSDVSTGSSKSWIKKAKFFRK